MLLACIFSTPVFPVVPAVAQLEEPRSLLKADRPLEAIPAFEKALAASPQDENAELGLSEAYRLVLNFAKAREILERASREHPHSAAPLVALGRVDIQTQDYEKAIAHLKRALEIEPGNLTARLDLAGAYQVKGEAAAPGHAWPSPRSPDCG